MDKFKKLNVEDREYRLLPMAPVYGSLFCARLSVLLSSVLSAEADGLAEILSSINSVKKSDGGKESQQEIAQNIMNNEGIKAKLFRLAMKLLPHLNPKEFSDLCIEALRTDCFAGGKRLSDESHFNTWFEENRGDYFPVAIWAIWMHSGDFFAKGGPAFSALAGRPTP